MKIIHFLSRKSISLSNTPFLSRTLISPVNKYITQGIFPFSTNINPNEKNENINSSDLPDYYTNGYWKINHTIPNNIINSKSNIGIPNRKMFKWETENEKKDDFKVINLNNNGISGMGGSGNNDGDDDGDNENGNGSVNSGFSESQSEETGVKTSKEEINEEFLQKMSDEIEKKINEKLSGRSFDSLSKEEFDMLFDDTFESTWKSDNDKSATVISTTDLESTLISKVKSLDNEGKNRFKNILEELKQYDELEQDLWKDLSDLKTAKNDYEFLSDKFDHDFDDILDDNIGRKTFISGEDKAVLKGKKSQVIDPETGTIYE